MIEAHVQTTLKKLKQETHKNVSHFFRCTRPPIQFGRSTSLFRLALRLKKPIMKTTKRN